MDRNDTLALAFAQIPDQVRVPAEVALQKTALPVLVQGIAWD